MNYLCLKYVQEEVIQFMKKILIIKCKDVLKDLILFYINRKINKIKYIDINLDFIRKIRYFHAMSFILLLMNNIKTNLKI